MTIPPKTVIFHGHAFPISPKEVACPRCSVARVRAERTHRHTGEVSATDVTMECTGEDKLVLLITDGGVTGYEGVYVNQHFIDFTLDRGWWACAGTEGRWDGLFIPASEMMEALETLSLLPRNTVAREGES